MKKTNCDLRALLLAPVIAVAPRKRRIHRRIYTLRYGLDEARRNAAMQHEHTA